MLDLPTPELASGVGEPLPEVEAVQVGSEVPTGPWDALAAQVSAAGFTLLRVMPENAKALGSIRPWAR